MPPPPIRLAHLHLSTPITYAHSLRLQESILARHFAHRDALRSQSKRSPSNDQPTLQLPPPPPPTLLTFSTKPTYTVGRRHLQSNPISAAQQAFLTAGGRAAFHPSPRGGLLTYHAPGQLTAYAVVDLRQHGITPRCFVRTLEKSVMRTCTRFGVANVGTTSDPGVWMVDGSDNENKLQPGSEGGAVSSSSSSIGGRSEAQNQDHTRNQKAKRNTERKICAVGVQISRGITSHGIGLNVWDCPFDSDPYSHPHLRPRTTTETKSTHSDNASASARTSSSEEGDEEMEQEGEGENEGEGYLSWGFNRIVACGLEGKSVTWLAREGASPLLLPTTTAAAAAEIRVDDVAGVFAIEFARALGEDSSSSSTTTLLTKSINTGGFKEDQEEEEEKAVMVEQVSEEEILSGSRLASQQTPPLL